MHRPGVYQLGCGLALRIGLLPKHTIARDLDLHDLGQRIDHRTANPMQPARGRIRLPAELAARVQRRQDHLQRAQFAKLRMRIDRNAAPVIAHRQPVPLFQRHLDEAGVACHRLIHRVVENFRRQMMQRGLIRPADIHTRALTDRLQPLQDLNVLRRVIRVVTRRQRQPLLRLRLGRGG